MSCQECHDMVIAAPLPCHDTLDRPRRKLLLPSLVLLGHSRVDAYGSVGLQYSSEASLQHDENTHLLRSAWFHQHVHTHAHVGVCSQTELLMV